MGNWGCQTRKYLDNCSLIFKLSRLFQVRDTLAILVIWDPNLVNCSGPYNVKQHCFWGQAHSLARAGGRHPYLAKGSFQRRVGAPKGHGYTMTSICQFRHTCYVHMCLHMTHTSCTASPERAPAISQHDMDTVCG